MNKKRKLIIILLVPVLLFGSCAAYVMTYYHADETAICALESDRDVTVSQTDYGWFFDGPSDTDALIFYPGGKVEETAYAPLLRQLAAGGMDVMLVKMPFRLAVLSTDKAQKAMENCEYEHWYIGGHSLGGVCAADYASAHSGLFDGVILLAAYPSKPLPDTLKTVFISGSEDKVLNAGKYESGKQYAALRDEYIIDGGNHAQFGSYGFQSGDGTASITASQQISITVEDIFKSFCDKSQ